MQNELRRLGCKILENHEVVDIQSDENHVGVTCKKLDGELVKNSAKGQEF